MQCNAIKLFGIIPGGHILIISLIHFQLLLDLAGFLVHRVVRGVAVGLVNVEGFGGQGENLFLLGAFDDVVAEALNHPFVRPEQEEDFISSVSIVSS